MRNNWTPAGDANYGMIDAVKFLAGVPKVT